MPDDPPPKGGNGDAGNRISFDYLKSAHFRVIRADGAIGGRTPSGHIHFALYSERAAIPRQTVHELKPDGKLGKQLTDETVSRGTIVREMEVDVFLTVETARSLAKWLDGEVKKASKDEKPNPSDRKH